MEKSLDPEDWEETRQLGHKMVDDMIDFLKNIRDRKTWEAMPVEVRDHLEERIPRKPTPLSDVYDQFTKDILPYPLGNIHPRFWGWVKGTGTVAGMFAEMLAAGMNSNLAGQYHVANHIELQVLNWMKEIFLFPPDTSGLLVSGCSMANLIGLNVARNAKIEKARKGGLSAYQDVFKVYCSTETHSSIQKSVELLGLGAQALRRIKVNDQFQIDLEELREALLDDQAQGCVPFCLIGNAGTVNTGAIDPLDKLAEIAKEFDLWFHVDGAFGSFAHVTPVKSKVEGITKADSLAFDMHKWMYLPYGIGVILVRDRRAHFNSFNLTPEYLVHSDRGVHAGKTWFSDFGLELSRSFKGLKAWMSIKEHGMDKFAEIIYQNIQQAEYLKGLVESDPKLELMAPVSLNLVCFRYRGCLDDQQKLNGLNEELILQIHESGVAVPSYTTINGNYVIRVAITNHRSRQEDFDYFIENLLEIGERLEEATP